ncbi:rhomboid-like protein [Frankia sp. CiP3]|uniref:rhomboid-like protein n=1 Tax=Frankia sp. CiP3 TaxID=2880971 RepID=UPI001EF60CB7|nr:rhomboid-like protein [Frankia sp. CiP3]
MCPAFPLPGKRGRLPNIELHVVYAHRILLRDVRGLPFRSPCWPWARAEPSQTSQRDRDPGPPPWLPSFPWPVPRTGWDLLRQAWHTAPLAMIYIIVLAATSAALAVAHTLDFELYHRLLVAHSTNLTGLRTRPLYVLLASACWLDGFSFFPSAAAVAAVVAPLERMIGSRPALGVFATGHIGASLLVAGGLAAGRAMRLVDDSVTDAVDVGASYGLIACGAVLAAALPSGRRWPLAGALTAGLALDMAREPDFTAAGHLLSAALGLLCSQYLRRRRPLRRPAAPNGIVPAQGRPAAAPPAARWRQVAPPTEGIG